ncbi:MAG: ankyrin repeat domain-containing protein [Fimbriimonadaceae bacterium]|nr:ankyrin repeat domain-containing protein [Fimbriimonadaceae bacterium]
MTKAAVQAARAVEKAITAGDRAAVARLLAAEPELVLAGGPLVQACAVGDLATAELLLAAGADPNGQADAPFTPVHRAAMPLSGRAWSPGHEACLRLLAARGADLQARCWAGLTPLGMAARRGDGDGVRILLELVGDQPPDLPDACCLGDADRVLAILDTAPERLEEPTVHGYRPLHLACESRAWQYDPAAGDRLARIVGELLDRGASDGPHEVEGECGATPLDVVCGHGAEPAVLAFFSRGRFRGRPFERLLGSNRVALLDHLPPEQWRPNLVSNPRNGNTLLGESVRYGQLQAVRWLLDHGADPRLADSNGWTPLHYAARRGLAEPWLRALLAAGADPRAVNHDGQTPADLARERGKVALVAVLSAGRS